MNRNILCSLIVLIVIVVSTLIVIKKNVDLVEYKNNLYSIKYDSTWKKSEKSDKEFKLIHKRSKATLDIKVKEIDDSYIDTDLDELIDDIVYGIKKQNNEYKLLSKDKLDNNSYSYMFENDNNNVLVNIYKKDNNIVFIYYEAEFKYFDIVLDSVDSIIESFKFI